VVSGLLAMVESRYILAEDNKSWCYKAGLPEVALQYQCWYYLLPRCRFGHFNTYCFYV